MVDVLVIGSGPAGYTAAIYAVRAGYKVQLLSGTQLGGQLTVASFVENYPGFIDPIMGPVLMDNMRQQAEKMGVEIIYDTISEVNFSTKPFVCIGDKEYSARAIVIATGAQAKWLGLDSELQYRGKGVSACATCDGFFFKNKIVAVVGGGNTALDEALYLTNFAAKVFLIHRRDSFSAEKVLQERVLNNPKITLILNSVVQEICGDGSKVSCVKLLNRVNNSVETVDLDGMFIAIGHFPATEIFKGHIALDDNGYIIVDNQKTSVNGIFAAGDVCDKIYRQAVVAAGEGCKAAIEVDKYLSAMQ